jgi:hypothetical protein
MHDSVATHITRYIDWSQPDVAHVRCSANVSARSNFIDRAHPLILP